MRNSYLLGLGGALLATTSLSSAASAMALYNYTQANATVGNQGPTSANAFTPVKIGAQLFASGGLTVSSTLGSSSSTNIWLALSNQYGSTIPAYITLSITGASFSQTGLGSMSNANLSLYSFSPTANASQTAATITATASGATSGCVVGILGTTITINTCNIQGTNGANVNSSFLIGAIGLSGVLFSNGTGLATAGASVQITGVVTNSAASTTYESMAAATVITSTNVDVVTIGTAAASVGQGTGTVPFINITQTLGNAGNLTAVLAAIYITGSGSVGSDLATQVPFANVTGNLTAVVTSAALSDPAISNVRLVKKTTGASIATSTTLTGTATFSNVSSASIYTAVGAGTNFVQVEYSGAASLLGSGGAVGTTSLTFSALTGQLADPAVSGNASSINRAGLITQVNSVQASTNTAVQSYVRITNGGSVAGTVLITVYNAATGASLGSMTSASIPGFSTLQLSAAQIETGANFTAVTGGSYDLVINGALPVGYVQHVTGNPGGVFTDFSGRRQSAAGTN